MTRQREWQLQMRAANRCTTCGSREQAQGHKRILLRLLVSQSTTPRSKQTEKTKKSMKNIFAIIPLIALVLVTGCSNTKPLVTPAVVKSGSSSAVSLGVKQWPEARPYVAASIAVLCSQAAGTNLSPASLEAALEASPIAAQAKTLTGVIVLNSMLMIYNVVWNSFVSEAVANSLAKPYLQAACDGGNEGLAVRGVRSPAEANKWPQVRYPSQ